LSLFTVLSLFGLLLRDVWKHARSEAQIFDTNERLNGTIQELKNQTAELSLITSMRQELQLCTTPDEAHRTTVRYAAKALPKAKIALMKIDSARRMMQVAATSDDQTQILDEFPVGACCGLRAGRLRRRKACKAAMNAMTASMAKAVAADGITVNAVFSRHDTQFYTGGSIP